MNGEVQLIVRTEKLPDVVTANDYLATNITSGDTSCFGSAGQSLTHTVGSKIEIVDQNVSPEVVLFTRYVTGYNDATGEINVNEPFTSNVIAGNIGIYVYTLTITEGYLDLFENESISQNWKFQDLSNFTAQGAFSREFRLPFSETNKEALGALFDNNVEQGAENYFFYKLPAEIRVDTLPIATGYLRVRKVYKQMGKLSEVEVAFYAETPDLVRTIGEKKLSDIAALVNLNELYNYADVTTETADRIWTLCDRGQKWSNDGTVGSRPILDPNNPIAPADLTPAVNWWFLFNNIITEAGFELVAGSLQNILSDYWMPFCNSRQLAITSQPNAYFFRAYNSTSLSVTTTGVKLNANTEVFDNSGNYNTTNYEYTVPFDGEYTFNGVITIDGTTLTGSVNFIRIGLYGIISPTFLLVAFSQQIQQTNSGYAVPFTFTVPLSQGMNVSLGLQGVNIAAPFTVYFGTGILNRTFWEINNTVSYSNQTVDYQGNAPDMRQIDFISDVIKMHNCAIIPSRTVPNRILIAPQNSYIGTGDTLDWTSKLDISKDVTISSTVDIQKATFQFTYTAGEDVYSKLYRDANRVYGDYKAEGYTINPSTAPSDFAIGDQKVQLVTRSAPAAFIPGTQTPIQCFYNEQLEFVAPGSRALYYANTIDICLVDEVNNTSTPPTAIPVLNHYSNTFPNIDDYDLNWAPEVPPHIATVIANPYNNLFNLYWRNFMNELYSPEGRIMEAFFALDLKDILTFSFADKIWIQDSYWRILEISDYKVGYNESTKIKLIKFLDQVNDCSSTPVGVSENGEVNFENGEGDPVEATEDCCSRYGYFWDEVNGVCWASNNGGQFRNSIVTVNNIVPTGNDSLYSLFASQTKSVVEGENINVIGSNPNSLIVGKDLTLTKSVDGSNLLGKNAISNLPGLHIGGGYRLGTSASTEMGWAQSGVTHFHVKDSFASAGATQEMFIEGIAGEHLDIPDSTTMSCMLNLTIQDEMQNDIDVALLSFGLTKVGGVAYATPVTVISNDTFGTGYTYTITIDTATNTAQHRIILTINAAPSLPITLIATASLHYQQNKLA